MHQGDNFPLPSKAVLVGSRYRGPSDNRCQRQSRDAIRCEEGSTSTHWRGPWEAALRCPAEGQSTDIDILKFAFKLQIREVGGTSGQVQIVKPGHAVAAGP